MLQKFDSTAESNAFPIFEKFGAVHCPHALPTVFIDKEGATFNAYADFYHAGAGIYLEFKAGKLNSVGSKRVSQNGLNNQASRPGGIKPYHQLKFGWNHSAIKQAIVQAKLTPLNFVVVFEKAPDYAEAMKYHKRGITFCTLESLGSYLGFATFRKRGLNVGFSYNYPEASFSIG